MTDTDRDAVERWEVTRNENGLGYSNGIRQSPHGNFVSINDYRALLAAKEQAEAERDALREALTLIERLYYLEGKSAKWRAARMNGVAFEAQNGNDLGHYRRIFPRAAIMEDKTDE